VFPHVNPQFHGPSHYINCGTQARGAPPYRGGEDAVLVRDTMQCGGVTLSVSAVAWGAFLATI
jgi:hypothetical protein